MILVFGQNGQVAREIRHICPNVICLGRDQADLSDPENCAAAIRSHAPSAVINAAAYTAVDRAEEEEALAHVINGVAPAIMAQACASQNLPFVHISTDYVFNGSGNTPFPPDHMTDPLGAYGRTKQAGELGIMAAGGTYLILRTSWVFSRHGSNFVKTILKLAEERDCLNVVSDQVGGPTPASAIAAACLSIAVQLRETPNKTGIHHFSGKPETSWADFARAIVDEAAIECQINNITTQSYPTPSQRPLNSRLDCTGLSIFGIERPDWRSALHEIIKELKGPHDLS